MFNRPALLLLASILVDKTWVSTVAALTPVNFQNAGRRSTAMSLSSTSTPGEGSSPRPSKHYPKYFEQLPSMDGKTVVITGTSRGLGYVTALSLAKKGARVIGLNRKSDRAEESLAEISRAATTGDDCEPPLSVECDLLDFASVREAASVLRETTGGRIDVLCCNAGIMLQPDEANEDGYDITIATNVLSHFLLVRELLPTLEDTATRHGEARVVTMSSGSGFGQPGFNAKYFSREGGNLGGMQSSYERYHQSKLGNLAFTQALHEKLMSTKSGVKSLACTPGVCATDMFAHVQALFKPGQPVDMSKVPSVEDGSLAQLKCICDPTVRSGQLFSPGGITGEPIEVAIAPPTVLVNEEVKDTLWAACESAVGPFTLCSESAK